MSTRRLPGEVVRRKAGSGFRAEEEPQLVRVPSGVTYEMDMLRDAGGTWQINPGGEASFCMIGCGDTECREWANVEVMSGDYKGNYLYHISECQMHDVQPEDTSE